MVPCIGLCPVRGRSDPCRFAFRGGGRVLYSRVLMPCGGRLASGDVDVIIRSCSVDC